MFNMHSVGKVSRRVIGDVNVFDMSGAIKSDRIRSVREYMAAYIDQGHIRYAIVNVQELNYIDNNSIQQMLEPLGDLKKTALFYSDNDIGSVFKNARTDQCETICNRESDIVEYMGEELVNKRPAVPIDERRKSSRIKSAISADVICRQNNTNDITVTSGIITNISEMGVYIEYLDLNSAQLVSQIDFFKNVEAAVQANHPFYLGQKMNGEVIRIEISGRQTSIVVKFYDSIILEK